MKILIDKNIPYIEHFFQDYLNDIEYFTDQDFDISKVAEDSIVITRSTYKTHGKKISNAVISLFISLVLLVFFYNQQ